MSSLLRMVGQLVLRVGAIRIHHSPIPSRLLSGSEGWSFPIFQFRKIGTTSRVEKASEQTLVGLNMTWNEKERKGQGKEEEMAGLGHRWCTLRL